MIDAIVQHNIGTVRPLDRADRIELLGDAEVWHRVDGRGSCEVLAVLRRVHWQKGRVEEVETFRGPQTRAIQVHVKAWFFRENVCRRSII